MWAIATISVQSHRATACIRDFCMSGRHTSQTRKGHVMPDGGKKAKEKDQKNKDKKKDAKASAKKAPK